MSSLLDAVIQSDNITSEGPSAPADQRRQKREERRRLGRSSSRPRSSSRLQGPPSISADANSEADGYLDDDDPALANARRRKNGIRNDVPRVVDRVGEAMAGRFEDFLEQ